MAPKTSRFFWCSMFLCTAMAMTSCGESGDGKAGGESKHAETVSQRDIKAFDEEIQTLIRRSEEVVAVAPTAFDKIADALKQGRITKVEAVTLTFIAAFDEARLPESFQAPMPKSLPDGILMEVEWWLHENWGTLPPEQQEALAPFYVRPTDPRSIYHPDNKKQQKNLIDRLRLIAPANASPGAFKHKKVVVSTNPKRVVHIYYTDNPYFSAEDRAKWIEESMLKAWPKFKSLFGQMPTEDIHLFLAYTGLFDGTAIMCPCGNSKCCEIKVKETLDERRTKAAASHELFHCFQYYIPLKYDVEPRRWMMEATAKWSEHYVWPDYNTEWNWLGSFFSNMDKDMIAWNRDREYATYMWYLFLSQQVGPGVVIKDLKKVESKDGRLVVASTDHFNTLFAEFALWNWNQDPELRYRDVPQFPTGMVVPPAGVLAKAMYPNGKSYRSKVHAKGRKDNAEITLGALSMGYRLHAIKDNVDKLEFKFEKKGDEQHKRQVLIKIGDIWHWEEWTDLMERSFCRTRDEERVKAVVLIASNAEIDKKARYNLKYQVITEGKCNPEWRGTTKWSWQFSKKSDFPVLNAVVQYDQDSAMMSWDTLVYDEAEGEFMLKEQAITYSYNESQVITWSQDCGMQRDAKYQSYKGATCSSWKIDDKYPSQSDAPTRIERDDDDPMRFEVDVDAHAWKENWIKVTDRRETRRKACPLEGISTPSPGTYDRVETDIDFTKRFRNEPYNVEVLMSKDKKHIKGTVIQKASSGDTEYDITIEVNYSYQ